MIKEERVILMTKLASYEETEGKRAAKINGYFRSDYLSAHLLKGWIGVTISYILVVGFYILYDFDIFMENLYKMDYAAFAGDILVKYAVAAVIYLFITYVVYAYRYRRARKSLKRYQQNLKKLGSMYQK